MAKQQGLNSTSVWMIVFVGLWLASTVFLVILYTGQEKLNEENARLRASYAKTINPQQERSIELVKSATEAGPTVVGLLEEARGTTAQLATGEATDAASAVRTKRDQILVTIKSDGLVSNPDSFNDLSYHESLTRLYEAYKSERALRKTAEDRSAQLETQANTLVEADAARKNDFEKHSRELSERAAQAEGDRAAYRSERDKEIESLKKSFDDAQKRHDTELTHERQVRLASEQQLGDFQKRFSAYQAKFGALLQGPEKLSTARRPDGKILTSIPGDKNVYINLGRKNSLTLGLKFAVYSAQTGIPEDGRAKAQIEVVSISESSAECRINAVAANEVILEGDLIANPIYDPDRPLSFVVAGDFDLDHDGNIDPGGTLVVESLVKNWGGVVTVELTPLTDFVVLGVKPHSSISPRGAAGGSPDASASPSDRFEQVSSKAKTLAVPVLPQDVFLNFLGFTNRYARR